MARKSSSDIQPDNDDLDGQNGGDAPGNSESENGTIGIDPAGIIDDNFARDDSGNIIYNKSGSPRKKRGRKPGSFNASKGNREDLKNSIDTLANMIGFAHIGIATISKCPEMALEENEAKAIAGATARVLEVFEIRPDPRIEAIVGFGATIGPIYASRYFMIRNRVKKEREDRANFSPDISNVNVFPMGNVSEFN